MPRKLHRKEPFRTTIFVHYQNVVENRSAMSCSVIITSKFAALAWMLRPVVFQKNSRKILRRGALSNASFAIFLNQKI
jgi:hypothetical protein